MSRLELPMVTLCAASSVNVEATQAAMRSCMDQVEFAECLLFTDARVSSSPEVKLVKIEPLRSARDYSEFLLARLAPYVATSHCLVVQWDGFVVDALQWDPRFLNYDYVGAPWPQFGDGLDVGNGGFSLRSARLLQACLDPRFHHGHPEDVAICRSNRELLERHHGIRFAERSVAERFSRERSAPACPTFGFHGVFNVIPLFGIARFAEIYGTLDNRASVYHDLKLLLRQLAGKPGGGALGRRLIIDWLRTLGRRLPKSAQAAL